MAPKIWSAAALGCVFPPRLIAPQARAPALLSFLKQFGLNADNWKNGSHPLNVILKGVRSARCLQRASSPEGPCGLAEC
jgi:hypothetical protein